MWYIFLFSQDDRVWILKALFLDNLKFVDSQGVLDNLTSVALKTEGYVERDLFSLVQRSIFVAMERIGKYISKYDKINTSQTHKTCSFIEIQRNY